VNPRVAILTNAGDRHRLQTERQMRKRSKWILTGIGVIVIALGTMYAVALARSTARLREVYAALEKDGRPMNAADVIPAKVPDEQNAAVLYTKAASMLKTQPARDNNLLKDLGTLAGAPFTKTDRPDKLAKQKEDVAELKRLMAQDVVTQAISLIEQGTQRPACQFEHDYERVIPSSPPATEDLRNLIRVVGTKAYLEAEAGRAQKAWDMIPAMLRFADAQRNEPGAFSHYIRGAMINYSCGTIRRLCEMAPPSDETYRQIEGLLASFDDVKPWIHAVDAERLLRGERLFDLPEDELFEELRKNPWGGEDAQPGPGYRLIFRLVTFKPRFVADHAAYLQLMRKHTLLLQGPYVPRESQDYKEIERLLRRNYVTDRFAPSVWGVQWIYCRGLAFLRITRAGLAAVQYKQAHGTWASSLDALGLKDLTDPYIQQPLHYRAEGEGFIVYSVNEDQQDNGGISEPLERRGNHDTVWRFPEPKAN